MSSELLKAQSNCISTECIHSTFRNLINISLVQEFIQENKFGCFISALLITQFWLNKSYDEKTRSTPADDATDVNSLRMEFRTSNRSQSLFVWSPPLSWWHGRLHITSSYELVQQKLIERFRKSDLNQKSDFFFFLNHDFSNPAPGILRAYCLSNSFTFQRHRPTTLEPISITWLRSTCPNHLDVLYIWLRSTCHKKLSWCWQPARRI